MSETADYGQAERASIPVSSEAGTIDQMREGLGYLHDRIDLLTHRLESVLGPDFPQMVEQDKVPDFAPIQKLSLELARAGGRIDNLLARLVL